MNVTLLIDFGSTFTKIRALDLAAARVLGAAQAPSTVDTDMTVGYHAARAALLRECGLDDADVARQIACSSAAGGLGIGVVGLVPRLTTDAARKAAFGAGGKVVASYSNKLTEADLETLAARAPDLVLLAGGTDGGNEQVVRWNADRLAASDIVCPILYAGNRVVAEEVRSTLERAAKNVLVAANIMPELNQLQLEPTHHAIRELFIASIVHGKGLDRAQRLLGGIIMPTPLAVLHAAELLARGTDEEPGIGDLVVVDVGGATTDVNSLVEWRQANPAVMQKGLPEPYAFRTVEGDLGVRYNAAHILDALGAETLVDTMRAIDPAGGAAATPAQIRGRIARLGEHTGTTPGEPADYLLDAALARHAVRTAVMRHAGRLEPHHTADGMVYFQYGKDLGGVATVIATGGVFRYGRHRDEVLQGACAEDGEPLSLRPRRPAFVFDDDYLLYAIGLAAEVAPTAALRIAKRHLLRE